MSQSSRKSIKDKIARQIQDMKTPVPIDSDRRTGRQQLQSILAPDVVGIPTQEELEVETKPKVVLYLREGLKGATKNWTKYPNDIHDLCTERLNEYETVIYYKLWRESWGYGRNYCRIGYNKILKETPLRSLPTVRRSVIGLREKQFIIMALDDNNEPNITRAGTLYRTCTPFELISGQTEEGIAFEDIPATGVICETIVEGNTVSGNIVTENSDLTDSSQGDQGGVISGTMIPQITVEKSKENKAPGKGDLTDSSHADHLIT